ncbi:MAG: GNAT family N-acetyltransferase [Microscillaceae bacterium]|nr:GNAT family N-acetyltransferase [Microscillaceae bacterium]
MLHLLPQTLKQIEFFRAVRGPHARPQFKYQNLPDSARLAYELVNWDNFTVYLDLFAQDTHPFVDQRFKIQAELEEYMVGLLEYARLSPKRGGCDWFIRLLKTNEYIGVLHVYDLNKEIFEGFHPPCYLGYALAEAHRKQGFAEEATRHLLEQIPLIFERYEVMAGCKPENLASIALLEKLGFRQEIARTGRKTDFWYKKLTEGEIPPAKWDLD